MTPQGNSLLAKLGTPRRWAIAAWCGVPVVVAVLLVTPSVTPPGDNLGFRRFQTPLLGPELWLGQTFSMPGDGMHAIEVFPAPVGERVSGFARFVLYDVTEGRPVRVRGGVVTANSLMRAPSYLFEFPPIVDSADHSYRLDISTTQAEGVAFWATKGERYADGNLRINDHDRWADLAFQTHAPAPSIWRLLMTLRDEHPMRGYIVIGAFASIWLLLGLVVRDLAGTRATPVLTDSVLTASR